MNVQRILLLGFVKDETLEHVPDGCHKNVTWEESTNFSTATSLSSYNAVLLCGNGLNNIEMRRIRVLLSQREIKHAIAYEPKDVKRHIAEWTRKSVDENISEKLREFIQGSDDENEQSPKRLNANAFMKSILAQVREKFADDPINRHQVEMILVSHRRARRLLKKVGIDEEF